MKNLKIKNTILALIVLVGIILITLQARKGVEIIHDKKQATADSIALLNRLLVNENQKYINVMVALDSISRKGGVLEFTNFEGKQFQLILIVK